MAEDDPLKITKEDILKEFLVTEKYGENGPKWPNITIAACKITWTDEDGKKCMDHIVYNSSGEHAERKLIKFLKTDEFNTASNIKIEVYLNYSPCKECAGKICEYMNSTGDEAEMTITFANFYKTHVYPGNSQDNANANIEGLQRLYNHGYVTLQLFGVHFEWEEFLGMSQFFSLTEEEKNECLKRADSQKRKYRERQDETFWNNNILSSVDEITTRTQELRV